MLASIAGPPRGPEFPAQGATFGYRLNQRMSHETLSHDQPPDTQDQRDLLLYQSRIERPVRMKVPELNRQEMPKIWQAAMKERKVRVEAWVK